MGHALGEEALASGGARGPPRELKSAIAAGPLWARRRTHALKTKTREGENVSRLIGHALCDWYLKRQRSAYATSQPPRRWHYA